MLEKNSIFEKIDFLHPNLQRTVNRQPSHRARDCWVGFAFVHKKWMLWAVYEADWCFILWRISFHTHSHVCFLKKINFLDFSKILENFTKKWHPKKTLKSLTDTLFHQNFDSMHVRALISWKKLTFFNFSKN